MEQPARTPFQKLTDPLLYAAVRGVGVVVSRVGPRAGYRLASVLGFLWFHLFRKRHWIVHRNLEIAFGSELGKRERNRIGWECSRHALATAVDVLVREGRLTRKNSADLVAADPVLMEALSLPHPRGLAILSAHIGSWEMGQFMCGLFGTPVCPVVRSLDNPYLNRESTRLRSPFGEEVLRKIGALRRILQVLRRGGRVGIVVDQNAPPTEEYLDFFGVPAATYVSYAKVLVRQGCDVLFTACLREGFRFRFRMFSRRIEIPRQGSVDERARSLVKSYLKILEEVIRSHPQQYLWMHRRWKRRPLGAASLYNDLGKPLQAVERC